MKEFVYNMIDYFIIPRIYVILDCFTWKNFELVTVLFTIASMDVVCMAVVGKKYLFWKLYVYIFILMFFWFNFNYQFFRDNENLPKNFPLLRYMSHDFEFHETLW